MGYIKIFENMTHTQIKDCFFGKDKELFFIVNSDQVGMAVGKEGKNVKLLAQKLKLRLKVIGFDKDPVEFVKNILYPLKEYEVNLEGDKIVIKPENNVIKGRIYGRDRSNLKWINDLLKRHFGGLEVILK